MEPSWKQADVFPIIARIIEQPDRGHQRFVTAQEIIARLLQDSEGRKSTSSGILGGLAWASWR